MEARPTPHSIDLACGMALALVVTIDLFTASSLSLVASVQPNLVAWASFLETRLSQVNLVCVIAVLATWSVLFRARHRRPTPSICCWRRRVCMSRWC